MAVSPKACCELSPSRAAVSSKLVEPMANASQLGGTTCIIAHDSSCMFGDEIYQGRD